MCKVHSTPPEVSTNTAPLGMFSNVLSGKTRLATVSPKLKVTPQIVKVAFLFGMLTTVKDIEAEKLDFSIPPQAVSNSTSPTNCINVLIGSL